MENIREATFPDEQPTRPAERISTRMVAVVARIDRLAELAQERLLFGADDDAVAQAATELASIRHLCSEVQR